MPTYTMPDGEKLYVRRFGQGKPVLVLSGLGMQSWQWHPYLLGLQQQFEFMIPDWRGFGGSKHCKIPKTDAISSHWQDISCLIDQLKLQQFVLIGYSMGATTAMHGMKYGHLHTHLKAYLHIDQTPKISADESWPYGLFGTMHPIFKQLLLRIYHLLQPYRHITTLDHLPKDIRSHLANLWADFIELQSHNPYSPKLFRMALNQPFLQKHLLPIQRIDYLLWYVENYLDHKEDYRDSLAELSCPTTFFIGRNSTLYPEIGQTMIANRVNRSKVIYFEHSGHTPLIHEPLKFRRQIHKFLFEQS